MKTLILLFSLVPSIAFSTNYSQPKTNDIDVDVAAIALQGQQQAQNQGQAQKQSSVNINKNKSSSSAANSSKNTNLNISKGGEGGKAFAKSGDSNSGAHVNKSGNSANNLANSVNLAGAVKISGPTIGGDTLKTGDVSNKVQVDGSTWNAGDITVEGNTYEAADVLVEGHEYKAGDVIVEAPIINEAPVSFDNYHGGNSVYMPRDVNFAPVAAQAVEVESVSVPTASVIVDFQRINSDGPYGDDKAARIGLQIPITWGLKTKDALSNARGIQEQKIAKLKSDIVLNETRQAQQLKHEREAHQGQMMEVCLKVYHTLGSIDPAVSPDLSNICGAYAHPKGAIPEHKGFCNPNQASPHKEECADPESEYHDH